MLKKQNYKLPPEQLMINPYYPKLSEHEINVVLLPRKEVSSDGQSESDLMGASDSFFNTLVF